MLVKRAKDEDQVYILLGDMNIEKPDGQIMQALRDSDMEVPVFPATNLGGDKHYDQMAFTVDGKAERKTRLIRAGSFDWRTAVFGRWPGDAPFPDDLSAGRGRRLSDAEQLTHYEPICIRERAKAGKDPYADFPRQFRRWTSYEMSDHLPIWVELEVDYSDDYLARYL